MKYIRFKCEDKKEFSVPWDQAAEILRSPSNLVAIKGPDGEWTGETINKLKVMYTERDTESERRFAMLAESMNRIEAPEPEVTENTALLKQGIAEILKR